MAQGAEIGALLARAGQCLAAGDARGAEAPLREALARAPGLPEALFMSGVARGMTGDHAAALPMFAAVLRQRPGFAQAQAQTARSLDALDRRGEAIAAAKAVAAMAADPWSLDTAGVVLTRAGRHAEAAALYSRAAAAGGAPGYHYNHGSALVFLGRFDAARQALRQCLARDPDHGPAWAMLVQITRQTRAANELPRLMALAQRLSGNAQAMHVLGHAIAKTHEDLGDPAEAMAWLARAKAGMRGRMDPEADAALFGAAERSLTGAGEGTADEAPILVVGLPRTGTTLLERILSSHSGMTSAGEVNDFPNVLKAATGVSGPRLVSGELIDAASRIDLDAAGRTYLARVAETIGDAGRFVDKLPLNVFLAPLILRALPRARVLCLRRHPADAVLSNYRQAFDAGATGFDYAFDLEETARYVVRFEQLLDNYVATLPADGFLRVNYEDLVHDLEAEVRRVLDVCGLPFEAACVRFEDNASPVATASAAQVREPINARAVGRWKNYRPALDPALQILVVSGVMDASELD